MRKQSIIDLGMYNKHFSGAEDYELWVRAWKSGLNIQNMNEVLIRYHLNLGRMSFKRIWNKYYVGNYIIKKYDFPLKYYFHNFAKFVKDVLIKARLYNPMWSVRNLLSDS